MTRIVMVTKFAPLPADSGGKQRSLAMLRRLLSVGDVALCAFDGGSADVAGLLELGVDVHTVPAGRDATAAATCLVRTGSISAARFASRELAAAVRAAAGRRPVDLLFMEHPQLLPYARFVPATRRILDMQNVESALMASYRRSARRAHRVVASVEERALRRLEQSAREQFDEIVVVSETDRARLPGGPAKVLVCPNGWDVQPPLPASSAPVAAFVALLGWRPNVDAAVWLAREVWPAVRAQVPEAELLLVGRDPTPAVRSLAAPDVTVTGTVPSVRPYLCRARVGLAPLLAGGGSRLKILEALDAGRPVVATTVGAEGLEDLVGRGVVIADEPATMANAIAQLLTDPAEAARLGALGRATVIERYTWDRTLAPLAGRLEALR